MKVKHTAIVLLVACLTWPLLSFAKDFSGLDVVAVVDNSGSMYGTPKVHPGANDPKWFRLDGVKHILMSLGNNASRNPYVHRLAMVEFGGRAIRGLEWVELAHDPSNMRRPMEKADAAAKRLTPKKMGNTDTAMALALARQMMEETKKFSPNTNRHQVVLLVTDGRPYATGVTPGEMWRRIKVEVERLRSQGVELWVVGLNDFDNYWHSGDGERWRKLCGEPSRARLADSASAHLPRIFQDIVALWLGTQGHLLAGDQSEYECPPYQRRLEFDVIYTQGHTDTNQLKILDPTGRPLIYNSPTSSSTASLLEMQWLDMPPSGKYHIQRKPGAFYTIIARPLPARAALVAPKRTDLGEPCDLVVQVEYQPGHFLEPIPAYPLKVIVQMHGPDGPASFEAAPAGNGHFLARWTPRQKGTNNVSVLARAHNALNPSQAWEVFRVEAKPVEVDQRIPVYLRLDHPGSSGFHVLPWGASSDGLRMTLVDRQGRSPKELANLVEQQKGWLKVYRLDRWGKLTGEAVDLTQTSPGVFEGDLRFHLNWAKGQGWWEPLMVDIQVVPSQTDMKNQAYLKGLMPSADTVLKVKGNPFAVGSYPVRVHWWLLWLPPLLLLIILLGLLWWLLRKVVLARAIQAQDRELGGKRPYLVIFDKAEDYSGEMGQQFALNQPRLKLDGKAVDVDHKKEVFQTLVVKRSLKSNQPQVKVKYRWRGRKPYHEATLSMNDRKPLEGIEARHQWHFLLKSK